MIMEIAVFVMIILSFVVGYFVRDRFKLAIIPSHVLTVPEKPKTEVLEMPLISEYAHDSCKSRGKNKPDDIVLPKIRKHVIK